MTKKKRAKTTAAVPAASPPPPSHEFLLDPLKTTPAMRTSIEELRSTLLCPLCHEVFTSPSTLPGCGHTFCLSCMDDYSCNAWTCPVPNCGVPLTLRGGREGSYLRVNPQIQTVVTSLSVICETLNRAPQEWWNGTTTSTAKEDSGYKEEDSDDDGDADDNGKVVDFNKYSPCPSTRRNDDDDNSPEDSEQTEAFARPEQHLPSSTIATTNPVDFWMSPIQETAAVRQQDDDDNNNNVLYTSCDLPSQSPNCSPIQHVASQQQQQQATTQSQQASSLQTILGSTLDKTGPTTRTHSPPASSVLLANQTRPSPSAMCVNHEMGTDTKRPPPSSSPSVTTVLVASALTDSDSKVLESLEATNYINLVTPDEQNSTIADVAVCGNAELESADGFLVTSRTFGYLLAIAHGMAVVNISYFAAVAADSEGGYLSTIVQPPLNDDGNRTLQLEANYHKHRVIGVANDGGEWMAPQRAMQDKQQQQQAGDSNGGGTLLLAGYKALLFGDFDSLPSTAIISKKRSRRGDTTAKMSVVPGSSQYTRDRLERLLCACGGTVIRDVASLADENDGNNKVAVMLRPKPHPRDWRAARKELDDCAACSKSIPLICADWLLDSISDFRVKQFGDYTQAKGQTNKRST